MPYYAPPYFLPGTPQPLGIMQVPPPLQRGDTIALVCPARYVEESTLQNAIAWLEHWGFKAKIGATCTLRHGQYGGLAKARIDDFNEQLRDPAVRAIIPLRGGYGCLELIDWLDWDALIANPKWISGYSDITILLMGAIRVGVAAIHACMPIEWPMAPVSGSNETRAPGMKALYAALTQSEWGMQLPLGQLINERPNSPRSLCCAPLIGGNLSSLYSLLGSGVLPSFNGAFVFLEDVDEYRYHLRRMIVALRRAGVLQGTRLLLSGSFTRIHQSAFESGMSHDGSGPAQTDPLADPFGRANYFDTDHHLQQYIPTSAGTLAAGHGLPVHLPLPMGMQTEVGFSLDETGPGLAYLYFSR